MIVFGCVGFFFWCGGGGGGGGGGGDGGFNKKNPSLKAFQVLLFLL